MLGLIRYYLALNQVTIRIFRQFWLFFKGGMCLMYRCSMLFLHHHLDYVEVGMLHIVYEPSEFYQYEISQILKLLTCSRFLQLNMNKISTINEFLRSKASSFEDPVDTFLITFRRWRMLFAERKPVPSIFLDA